MIMKFKKVKYTELFLGERPYHTEISPLICRANKWTGFYMIGTSVMKEFRNNYLHQNN